METDHSRGLPPTKFSRESSSGNGKSMSRKLVTVEWSWPGADEWPSSPAPSGLGVAVGLVGLELALASHIEPESSHKKPYFDSVHPLPCFDLGLYP